MNIAEALKRMCEGNPKLHRRVFEEVADSEFVRGLLMMRALSGLSNKDMAKAMGCSPQKVTCMEFSNDDDLKVGDIKKYIGALGYELVLVVQHKED